MIYSFILFCALFLFSCNSGQGEGRTIIARVGDQELTSNNLDSAFSFSSIHKNKLPTLIDGWVDNTVLYGAAVGAGFTKDASLIKKRDEFYKNLVVTSFLNSESEKNISITKEDVRSYYLKNKNSFKRSEEEVSVEHYTTPIKGVGKTLRKEILSGKELSPETTTFTSSLETIKRGRLVKKLENPLFMSNKGLVGPVKAGNLYHLFKIVNRYKKGSQKTLSESFDEIYQRLYKKKTSEVSEVFLDSLKQTLNIYINPEYQ